MKKVKIKCILMLAIVSLSLISCEKKEMFDVNNPTVIQVWTYYSGSTKDAFDGLVTEFNETVGKEKGIVVDARSTGNVGKLAEEVLGAANEDINAKSMPHIFSAYPDSAYVIDKLGMVVDLGEYFSKEEIDAFYPDFIEAGKLGEDQALKILPIAKSSEIIYVNNTDFEKFVDDTSADINEFATWEGVTRIAKEYYDWTDSKTDELNDGKALFGIDSLANYMIIGARQMGQELFKVVDGNVEIGLTSEVAKKLWDNYYVPLVSGYYADKGAFRSDDLKTGDVLSYIGSTAGSLYFPKQIETGKDLAYPIECITFPVPVFEGGETTAVHQGAGMVVGKSDEIHQEASVIFLKWFTEVKNNATFAVKTGYYPVKTEVLNIDSFNKISAEIYEDNTPVVVATVAEVAYTMIETHEFYAEQPFTQSFQARNIIEESLSDYAKADLERIVEMIESGKPKQQVLEEFVTEENFSLWYEQLESDLQQILK